MMIYRNKQWPIGKWVYCWEGLLEERLSLEMFFTFIQDFWRELLKWTKKMEEAVWLPYQLSRLKLEMSVRISLLMLFLLPMDKFSWKLNYSIKESDLRLMLDWAYLELVLMLNWKRWKQLLVLWNWILRSIEKLRLLPSSEVIWMRRPRDY